jgi:hypothetical protein
MMESHPPPEPGWSAALWPRKFGARCRLDALLCTWRKLIGLTIGSLSLSVAAGFCVYDALAGAPHAYTRFRNPTTELFFGPVGLAFFGSGFVYVVALMILKVLAGPQVRADPKYQDLKRLLPIRRD